ncbi:GFA family protein [Marinicella meishanensis]|uniref:GFA family protein n=1 Tax=Marinicella meishanensis TaxID=2873263 RepID=UPI001CBDFF57|nr:GFA family protein [Marinicella sp. NBU2979]
MTETRTAERVGGCACGQVRYQLKAAPIFVHCCHCSRCQRENGSAFALNAMIEAAQIDLLSGDVAMIDVPSASGRGQTMARCPQCQVALWSHYGGLGQWLSFVRVGTLDDPQQLPPDVHIYTSTQQAWFDTGGQIPVFAEYYDRHELWDADQLARFDALLKLRQAAQAES